MVDNTCDVHVASIDRSREATEALGDARSMGARSRGGGREGWEALSVRASGTRDDARGGVTGVVMRSGKREDAREGGSMDADRSIDRWTDRETTEGSARAREEERLTRRAFRVDAAPRDCPRLARRPPCR